MLTMIIIEHDNNSEILHDDLCSVIHQTDDDIDTGLQRIARLDEHISDIQLISYLDVPVDLKVSMLERSNKSFWIKYFGVSLQELI